MSKQAFRQAYQALSREALSYALDVFEVSTPERVDATQRTQFLRVASLHRCEPGGQR
jgi:hypothetical protein